MDEFDRLEQASWSPTVDVFINISYTKIFDIDNINQRFQAEVVIESKWFNPHIKSLSDIFDEKKIWKPELYIENAIKDIREDVTYRIMPSFRSDTKIVNEKNLMICEIRKVNGVFYENLELENFPLDVQDLSITVASKKAGNIVNFVLMQEEKKVLKISDTLDRSMWKLHLVLLARKDQLEREYSYGTREYPAIKISVKVFRSAGYFYWNAFLPFFLVVCASITPFVYELDKASSRISPTASLMLTSVGTRFNIGRLLPTVSYLTSIDKYSLGTLCIITMELLYHAIIGRYCTDKRNFQIAIKIDHIALVIFIFLIIIKQFIFIYWLIRVKNYRKDVHEGKISKLNDEKQSIKRYYEQKEANLIKLVNNLNASKNSGIMQQDQISYLIPETCKNLLSNEKNYDHENA